MIYVIDKIFQSDNCNVDLLVGSSRTSGEITEAIGPNPPGTLTDI